MDASKSLNGVNPACPGLSRASQQAVAILAVDGVQLSLAGVALLQALDAGTMMHSEAIQSIKDRAAKYAA